MMKPGSDKYEFYNPTANWPLQTKTIGYVVIESKFAAQRPGLGDGQLSMEYTITPKVVSFRKTLKDFEPGQMTLTLQPTGSVVAAAHQSPGVSIQDPVFSSLPTFSLPLVSGGTAPTQAVLATYSWTFNPQAGGHDFISLALKLGGFNYGPAPGKGLVRPHGNPPFSITESWSSEATMPTYYLRCDRNVARQNSSGCVFPDASPVFKLAWPSYPGPMANTFADAARHVYEAQISDAYSGGESPKTKKAPGRFKLLAGTRAIADTSGDSSFQGLEYAYDDAVTNSNRSASCTRSSSLWNLRGRPMSAACAAPNPPTCSCDEYPFASTYQGGAYSPESTSARLVVAADNSGMGRLLSQFLLDQRVFPRRVEIDPYWVDVSGAIR